MFSNPVRLYVLIFALVKKKIENFTGISFKRIAFRVSTDEGETRVQNR